VFLQNISAEDGLNQGGAELAFRAKKTANDLMDAKDEALKKRQGKAVT